MRFSFTIEPVNRSIITCLPLLLLFLGACQTGTQAPPPAIPTPYSESVTIGIASSAAPFADLIVTPFMAFSPATTINVVTANTNTLLADLAARQLDAVLVHALPPNHPFWFNPVALDGVALIIHPDNPIEQLSTAEVQALLSGRLTRWTAVGGADQPVHLLSREQGSGARLLINQQIMAEQRLSINSQLLAGNNALLTAVAANPDALGYTMMGAVPESVKFIAIDDIFPTTVTTANQAYRLTTPLYFVTREEPTGAVRTLLAWLQSPSGQEQIGTKYGRVLFSP